MSSTIARSIVINSFSNLWIRISGEYGELSFCSSCRVCFIQRSHPWSTRRYGRLASAVKPLWTRSVRLIVRCDVAAVLHCCGHLLWTRAQMCACARSPTATTCTATELILSTPVTHLKLPSWCTYIMLVVVFPNTVSCMWHVLWFLWEIGVGLLLSSWLKI